MSKSLLIILAKNPLLGKVKTRLAATMGDEKALTIYHLLLTHTVNITASLDCEKAVFYSDFIDREDKWNNDDYQKYMQHGKDLGERMYNAFEKAFAMGYEQVCIIGTDCFEITQQIISEGFAALEENDAVIGPARDGGYYLLGMKTLHKQLFANKRWSTDSIYDATTADFKKEKLAYQSLPVLNDIDNEKDWDQYAESNTL